MPVTTTTTIIDRIYLYLAEKNLSAYEFERKAGLSNGYLNSRKKGTRGIGSEILEQICTAFPDLNLIWLVLNRGDMLINPQAQLNAQPKAQLKNSVKKSVEDAADENEEKIIALLKEQIQLLKGTISDKDSIIKLLQQQLNNKQG